MQDMNKLFDRSKIKGIVDVPCDYGLITFDDSDINYPLFPFAIYKGTIKTPQDILVYLQSCLDALIGKQDIVYTFISSDIHSIKKISIPGQKEFYVFSLFSIHKGYTLGVDYNEYTDEELELLIELSKESAIEVAEDAIRRAIYQIQCQLERK